MGVLHTGQCGHKTQNGWVEIPCPKISGIPEFDEYYITYVYCDNGWSAAAKAKTPKARRFGDLYPYYSRGGMTKDDALSALYETYLMQFKHDEWRVLQKAGKTWR